MYYKLLNKTIFTGALLSLICMQITPVSAQELFSEKEGANIVFSPDEAPLPKDKDDIIPLSGDGLIEPAKPVQKDAKTEKKEEPKKQPSNVFDDADFDPIFGDKKADEQQPVNIKQEAKPADIAQNPKPSVAPQGVRPADPREIADGNPAPNAREHRPDRRPPAKPMPKDNREKDAQKPLLLEQNSENELKFGDSILAQTNNDLFKQMSDIEKQTTLLTLELKREKIRNEVEAAKAVRERAEREKEAAEKAKERQEEEWKKEQELKVIRAQQELQQKQIELEKLKQRKALTAYMNSMLEQKQAFIDETSKLYEEIQELKSTNEKLRKSYKSDLENISGETKQLLKNAETAKSNYERNISSLTAQNAQLKKRIEANEAAIKAGNANPFAQGKGENVSTSADALIKPMDIAKEYAIMEITGHGGELLVKLINKAGDSFVAKTGTVLQTGHMVEEITPTYVQFDRNGLKDFLYVSTNALNTEPNKNFSENSSPKAARPAVELIGDEKMPSLSDSMFMK